MKTKVDTSNTNLFINGEEVIAIKITKERLLGDSSPISKENEEKTLVIKYYLKSGARWLIETTSIEEGGETDGKTE